MEITPGVKTPGCVLSPLRGTRGAPILSNAVSFNAFHFFAGRHVSDAGKDYLIVRTRRW
jgi:hypothetical protein